MIRWSDDHDELNDDHRDLDDDLNNLDDNVGNLDDDQTITMMTTMILLMTLEEWRVGDWSRVLMVVVGISVTVALSFL